MKCSDFILELTAGKLDKQFKKLYTKNYKNRFIKLADEFITLYGDTEINVYSAPGRTEIGGNHTDHQNGCVLAAAINLDTIAIVCKNDENIVNLKSAGYNECNINLAMLSPSKDEFATSSSLIRGVAACFNERGYSIGGFNAVVDSNVLKGSGLSSSAAFEVLCGTIFSDLYNHNSIDAVEIACISQLAENVFFGKPSGLMDQMACSVGGFVAIDFADTTSPKIDKIHYDFTTSNYSLCIVDTKGNHADLTDEYTSITKEMAEISNFFGKQHLREVNVNDFYNNITKLRETTSDRAVLRAGHFFNDNQNAKDLASALNNNDLDKFLDIINKSGRSSYMYLQNIYKTGSVNQEVAVALHLTEHILCGKGAFRVHGGGFGGTMQAFVPNDLVDRYINELDNVFGAGSAQLLNIRNFGAMKIV